MSSVPVAPVKPATKKWWQSKTVWFNIITLVVGVASFLTKILPPATAVILTSIVIPAGNLILRIWFTNIPIGS